MGVIGEKGRLFGRANVVDLLVVFFVLAEAASVELAVGSPDDTDQAVTSQQRYAMLSFAAQLDSDAAGLSVGDSLSSDVDDVLEVDDVLRSFDADGLAFLTVRGAYHRNLTDDSEHIYCGDTGDLTTDPYLVGATILTVNGRDSPIPSRTTPVVPAINISNQVEQYLNQGQDVRFENRTVVTIRCVSETDGLGEVRLLVEIELRVWDRRGTAVFGGRALRVESPVTLVTDDVVLRGRVHEIDTGEPSPD